MNWMVYLVPSPFTISPFYSSVWSSRNREGEVRTSDRPLTSPISFPPFSFSILRNEMGGGKGNVSVFLSPSSHTVTQNKKGQEEGDWWTWRWRKSRPSSSLCSFSFLLFDLDVRRKEPGQERRRDYEKMMTENKLLLQPPWLSSLLSFLVTRRLSG